MKMASPRHPDWIGKWYGARLWSSLVWLIITLLTVGYTSLIILYALLFWWADPYRRGAHWLASLWGRSILGCLPSWRLTVHGRRRLSRRQPYIYVANHQSLLDIMVLFCINRPFKWVAKDSLFRIPLLGWAMAATNYIRLSRGKHGSIRDTYEQARVWLTRGLSVFFFPEGTRSPADQMLPFKNGAFKLALQTGVPVVPIAVHGTRDLLAKGRWLFRQRCRIHVTILPPINPSAYADAERLRDVTRDLIQRALVTSSASLTRHARLAQWRRRGRRALRQTG